MLPKPKSWGWIRFGCGTISSRGRSAFPSPQFAHLAGRGRGPHDADQLGTGVLVLPLRNPVVLAKELSSLDLISGGRLLLGMASGWYKREFDAVGVLFDQRGRPSTNLEILRRLWTEARSTASIRRITCAAQTCPRSRPACR